MTPACAFTPTVSRSATWRAWRRRRVCIFWPRATYACGARRTLAARCWKSAGYLAPEHRGYLRGIEKQMKDAGFAGEFRYHGELDRVRKIEFLRDLDVMSVPCTYDEPKGLSILEAMANGVPVVQPRRGAFPEILQRTGGGILVQPDDAGSLAQAIHGLWKNRERIAELGRSGAQGVRQHYGVAQMAARALEVYRHIASAAVTA